MDASRIFFYFSYSIFKDIQQCLYYWLNCTCFPCGKFRNFEFLCTASTKGSFRAAYFEAAQQNSKTISRSTIPISLYSSNSSRSCLVANLIRTFSLRRWIGLLSTSIAHKSSGTFSVLKNLDKSLFKTLRRIS